MSENEPIKSPYSKTKEVHTHTSAKEIANKGKDEFAKCLATLQGIGVPTNEHTLTVFSAGFMGAMKVLGLPKDDAERIATLMVTTIIRVGTEGPCDCPNCKK